MTVDAVAYLTDGVPGRGTQRCQRQDLPMALLAAATAGCIASKAAQSALMAS